MIVDSQVHVWGADVPARPWDCDAIAAHLERWRRLGRTIDLAVLGTYDGLLAEMDAVGVDAALVVTYGAYYPRDNDYVFEAAAQSHRLGAVAVIHQVESGPAREAVELAAGQGAIGIRVIAMTSEQGAALRAGVYDAAFAAAESTGLAAFVFTPDDLDEVGRVASAFPRLQLVVDHLAVRQPPLAPVSDAMWARLPELLSLAVHENVAVKLSGLSSVSAQPYPFLDLWPRVEPVLEAFGAQRAMWGTDTTRTRLAGRSYQEDVNWIRSSDRLSPSEKELVLGEGLRRWLGWPTEPPRAPG